MKSVLIIISVLAFGLCAQAQAPVLISSKKTLDKGWYTIAENRGNRASAKFSVREKKSGHHSTVHFYAQHHFGTDESNQINVLANSFYNNGGALRYIRILENNTYHGAYLQVYIDADDVAGCYFEISENVQEAGWALMQWEAWDEDNPVSLPGNGSSEHEGAEAIEVVRVDLDLNNGIILTDGLNTAKDIITDGNLGIGINSPQRGFM